MRFFFALQYINDLLLSFLSLSLRLIQQVLTYNLPFIIGNFLRMLNFAFWKSPVFLKGSEQKISVSRATTGLDYHSCCYHRR